MNTPLILLIMDGFGNNPSDYGNAIKSANTPNLDKYFAAYPNVLIGASGMDVGLPDGQMGNSEVGHTNIGAGRIVYQELTRISKSIADGDFFENVEFVKAIENCKANDSALHLCGLCSDGGVHSHNTHLYGLLELAKRAGLTKVYIHCFMDGRDVPPDSGKGFIEELCSKMEEIGVGKIATISGRYYSMDRELRWERVEKAYNAMTKAEGERFECPVKAMEVSYANGVTDEFVVPCVCDENGIVKDNDSVIFFNFRPDRAREITRAFVDGEFNGFVREKLNLTFVCMTQYDATMPNVLIAFKPDSLEMPIGEVISKNGMRQLRIAEYTKYAHVTFFLNGGREVQYEGEERILVDSPDVPTYDMQPEMSAYTVTDRVCECIEKDMYDFIVLNFANCDMVGHTGIFDAAKAAVEAVDECVGRVVDAILAKGGVAVVTADHGNADKMYEDDGAPFTAHTTFPVPFMVAGMGDVKLREGGVLADIAPTILKILGIEQPENMTGKSIIVD